MELSRLISVNFNLRSPKAKTATPLYMVVYYLTSEGKAIQAKIPTGKKILPTLWDSRKQQPIMINKDIDLTTRQLREQAEITAYIANCRILALSQNFSNFDEIKESITQQSSNNDMSPVTQQFKAATRTAKATKLISEALASYVKDRQVKTSTANEYQKNVKMFYNWIVSTNQRDSAKALTQSSFNAFVEWLKSNNTPSNVNKIASAIRRIIQYIAGTQAGSKYNITPVTFVNVKQVKEEKKCELLAEEIEAFKAIEVKNNKEQYYKDVFFLQLATGQRISDTLKLIKGDYKVQKGTPYNTIILTTIKRNKTSYITETKEVTELLEKIRSNKENEEDNEKDTSLAYYLKVLFCRANITRLTPSGKPINEVISSHFARHTFVTIKLREGYNFAQVGKMIGDRPAMIEKVYGHPSDEDIINSLQLQPAAGNTTPAQTAAGNTAAGTDTTTAQTAAAPQSKRIEVTKNIGGYDVTLQADGKSEIDNYLINKELNNKLIRLKEMREQASSKEDFDLNLQYICIRNEYRKLYNVFTKKVLEKLQYPKEQISNKSSEELTNTLYLLRGDLLQYVTKSKVKLLFIKSTSKDKEVDDLIIKIGVLVEILKA